MEGWLYKLGKGFRRWTKRWFQLRGEYLSYYTAAVPKGAVAEPKGQIYLGDVKRVEESDASLNEIQVVTSTRVYVLRSRTAVTARDWVVELQRAVRDAENHRAGGASSEFAARPAYPCAGFQEEPVEGGVPHDVYLYRSPVDRGVACVLHLSTFRLLFIYSHRPPTALASSDEPPESLRGSSGKDEIVRSGDGWAAHLSIPRHSLVGIEVSRHLGRETLHLRTSFFQSLHVVVASDRIQRALLRLLRTYARPSQPFYQHSRERFNAASEQADIRHAQSPTLLEQLQLSETQWKTQDSWIPGALLPRGWERPLPAASVTWASATTGGLLLRLPRLPRRAFPWSLFQSHLPGVLTSPISWVQVKEEDQDEEEDLESEADLAWLERMYVKLPNEWSLQHSLRRVEAAVQHEHFELARASDGAQWQRAKARWDAAWHGTGWPTHVQALLRAVRTVREALEAGRSVLLEGDGGVAHALACLVRQVMDPTARTLSGLAGLLQRDFVQPTPHYTMDGEAAAFVLYLDGWYQLQLEHGTAFESDLALGDFMLETLRSRRFATFLDRSADGPSLWSYLHMYGARLHRNAHYQMVSGPLRPPLWRWEQLTHTSAVFALAFTGRASLPDALHRLRTRLDGQAPGTRSLSLKGLGLDALVRLPRVPHEESLTSLSLARNALSVLPSAWALPALEQLSLHSNRLVRLPDGLQLPSLTALDLRRNELRSLPPEFAAGLPKLRVLLLDDNALPPEALRELDRLTALRRLGLAGNGLAWLPDEPLKAGRARLRALDLSRNALRSLPEDALRGLTRLRELRLEELPDLRPAPVGWLGSLLSLQSVDGSHSALSRWAEGTCACTGLHTLNLREVGLLAVPVWVREGLPLLRRLDVSGNGRMRALGELRRAPWLRKLRELRAARCALESLPPALADCARLVVLDVAGNRALRELPPALGRLPALRDLDVAQCDALASPPPHVVSLGTLAIRHYLLNLLSGPDPFLSVPLLLLSSEPFLVHSLFNYLSFLPRTFSKLEEEVKEDDLPLEDLEQDLFDRLPLFEPDTYLLELEDFPDCESTLNDYMSPWMKPTLHSIEWIFSKKNPSKPMDKDERSMEGIRWNIWRLPTESSDLFLPSQDEGPEDPRHAIVVVVVRDVSSEWPVLQARLQGVRGPVVVLHVGPTRPPARDSRASFHVPSDRAAWVRHLVQLARRVGVRLPRAWAALGGSLAQRSMGGLAWADTRDEARLLGLAGDAPLASALAALHAAGALWYDGHAGLVVPRPSWLHEAAVRLQRWGAGIVPRRALGRLWPSSLVPTSLVAAVAHALDRLEEAVVVETGALVVPAALPGRPSVDWPRELGVCGRSYRVSPVPRALVARLGVRLAHVAQVEVTEWWRHGLQARVGSGWLRLEERPEEGRLEVRVHAEAPRPVAAVYALIDALLAGWYLRDVRVAVPCVGCLLARVDQPVEFAWTRLLASLDAVDLYCPRCNASFPVHRLAPELQADLDRIDWSSIELLELIGEGSFAKVHKALWNGQFVAVKVLKLSPSFPPSSQSSQSTWLVQKNHEKSSVPKLEELEKKPPHPQQKTNRFSFFPFHMTPSQISMNHGPIKKPFVSNPVEKEKEEEDNVVRMEEDENELEMEEETMWNEFRKEMWVLQQIRHPNVMQLLGYGRFPLALITPYYTHGSLYAYLHQSTAGSPSESGCSWPFATASDPALERRYRLRIARDIARGMAALHEASPPIMHRDLKSPNILLADPHARAVAVVTDFGVSDCGAGLSRGRAVDCPLWLAPEVMSGRPYALQSDVYSYGVLLYELFAGRLLFAGERFMARIEAKVANGERPPLPSELPPPLAALLLRCWHQEPADRPSFAAIVRELETAILPACSSDDGTPLSERDLSERDEGGSSESSSMFSPPSTPRASRLSKALSILEQQHSPSRIRRSTSGWLLSGNDDTHTPPRSPALPLRSSSGEMRGRTLTSESNRLLQMARSSSVTSGLAMQAADPPLSSSPSSGSAAAWLLNDSAPTSPLMARRRRRTGSRASLDASLLDVSLADAFRDSGDDKLAVDRPSPRLFLVSPRPSALRTRPILAEHRATHLPRVPCRRSAFFAASDPTAMATLAAEDYALLAAKVSARLLRLGLSALDP